MLQLKHVLMLAYGCMSADMFDGWVDGWREGF